MDKINCPFCNNEMTIKKESGFLGNEYSECESCKVSFIEFKDKYQLKDFKEKTFLEKHKYTKVPYDEWVKIGQGQYTEEEIKEESELEFKETLDIKCPTCNTQFNKYHKKGLLSIDPMICPTCKARYEIVGNKYSFINIPDLNSKLWEHYKEQLTLDEIYAIFDKEQQINLENSPQNTAQNSNNNTIKLENLDCPFCNNNMTIKKESGFLGSDYYECESCEVSFTKRGDDYLLKDFKEKTFLEKHKIATFPYDEWVKIGQGQYTEEEIKEESELEFKETLNIKCPTCDIQFNKYHKKGLMNADLMICPTCKARYKFYSEGSYKFINIPDTKSKLWEHYNEELTIAEIYGVFDKKDELDTENLSDKDNPNIFECQISEGTVGFTSNRDDERYQAVVTLHDDYLEITKGSFWRNKDRGSKEILYSKITSVDLDIGGFLKLHAVELTVSGSEIICLMNASKDETTSFYNHLKEIIREYNLNKEKETVTQNIINDNQTSDADELMKWHQMMEQGIITEEEFEHKKKEILGL